MPYGRKNVGSRGAKVGNWEHIICSERKM